MTMEFHRLPGVHRHITSSVRRVLGEDGEPLSARVRADLEPGFGADFSTVRVHADRAANTSARQLGARAYTVGQHIVFGQNQFAPSTAAGRELLAHELTHTIQQGRVNGIPDQMTSRPDGVEAVAREMGARDSGARALAGAAPSIAPSGPAIARDEGTAEVVDTVTQFQQQGTVASATMQRDEFRTHAEAQQARQARAQGTQAPQAMDTGFAKVSMDTVTGAVTVPITVAVRAATPGDIGLDPKPPKNPSFAIASARVNRIADRFVAEVNAGLNNWFTLYVPPCQGVPFAGRELPITVKVTRTSAGGADFTVAVSPDGGRSFVSPSAKVVLLYAGDDLGPGTLRHEGAHMALGVPDEYRETDPVLRQQAPLQKSDERVFHDWTLAGDESDWGTFAMLRERHFSFVPVFASQVLASLHHPECVPVLHEARRPQPLLLRASEGLGYSSYGGGSFHVEAGIDAGRFLDRERSWRAFLGAHGQAFVGYHPAFLIGARLGFEHKWRSSQLGPTAEVYGETGAAAELGPGGRGTAPFAGAGASLGLSSWSSGKEWQVKLYGGEVLRLDHEGYSAFQAGLAAGFSW